MATVILLSHGDVIQTINWRDGYPCSVQHEEHPRMNPLIDGWEL